ncbi:hypothetical protein AKJ41_05835 [candidate division MSBL1 archaeon SCGC-AAA259O05]|uniref:Uncharacterized protein n=1 Tax=candidate division MSBL1 archaeon SCGC-AAA259O05 TaxID=1698271 RepID=A0A133UYB6_9EURY|nr:hypothetical protein AKJ41_05835 [candidate division MSBL1 archaeon SCGC-AAA259O05]
MGKTKVRENIPTKEAERRSSSTEKTRDKREVYIRQGEIERQPSDDPTSVSTAQDAENDHERNDDNKHRLHRGKHDPHVLLPKFLQLALKLVSLLPVIFLLGSLEFVLKF